MKTKRKWTSEELSFLDKYYPTASNTVLSKILDRTALAIKRMAITRQLKKKYPRGNHLHYHDIYALYKGETLLCDGTISDIAKRQGVDIQSIQWYGREVYSNRTSAENSRRLVFLYNELLEEYSGGVIDDSRQW